MIRDLRTLFESEENYYKPVSINNHIECKINAGRNRTLTVEEYLEEIRPYLKDDIINHRCY